MISVFSKTLGTVVTSRLHVSELDFRSDLEGTSCKMNNSTLFL